MNVRVFPLEDPSIVSDIIQQRDNRVEETHRPKKEDMMMVVEEQVNDLIKPALPTSNHRP